MKLIIDKYKVLCHNENHDVKMNRILSSDDRTSFIIDILKCSDKID